MVITSTRIYKVVFWTLSSKDFISMLPTFLPYMLFCCVFKMFLISLSSFKCEVVARRSRSYSGACCYLCKSCNKSEKFWVSPLYSSTSRPARPQSSLWITLGDLGPKEVWISVLMSVLLFWFLNDFMKVIIFDLMFFITRGSATLYFYFLSSAEVILYSNGLLLECCYSWSF